MLRMIMLTETSLDHQNLQNLLFQNHHVQVLKMLLCYILHIHMVFIKMEIQTIIYVALRQAEIHYSTNICVMSNLDAFAISKRVV